MLDRPRSGERALLLHIGLNRPSFDDEIQEFRALAESAGALVVGEIQARRERPDPKYFVGSGKVDEIGARGARDASRADSREPTAARGPGAQPRAHAEDARAGPQRLDPRHLRAARRDLRRQAPSRARSARAPRFAPRSRLDSPRAPEGRYRPSGSWRNAARNRPAAREPTHSPSARSGSSASSASAR